MLYILPVKKYIIYIYKYMCTIIYNTLFFILILFMYVYKYNVYKNYIYIFIIILKVCDFYLLSVKHIYFI